MDNSFKFLHLCVYLGAPAEVEKLEKDHIWQSRTLRERMGGGDEGERNKGLGRFHEKEVEERTEEGIEEE